MTHQIIYQRTEVRVDISDVDLDPMLVQHTAKPQSFRPSRLELRSILQPSGDLRWHIHAEGPRIKKDGTDSTVRGQCSLTTWSREDGHYLRADVPDEIRDVIEAVIEEIG